MRCLHKSIAALLLWAPLISFGYAAEETKTPPKGQAEPSMGGMGGMGQMGGGMGPMEGMSEAEMDKHMRAMQAHMLKMHDLMNQIRDAKNPKERERLMDEHLQLMKAHMKQMKSGRGCMMQQMMHGSPEKMQH